MHQSRGRQLIATNKILVAYDESQCFVGVSEFASGCFRGERGSEAEGLSVLTATGLNVVMM